MIESIKIRNFKSLKNISMNTRSLNLLSGLNGMGKSTLLQSLLLIKQSEALAVNGSLNLNGRFIGIGKGKDALYQFAEDDFISFEFGLTGKKRLAWSFEYKPSDVLSTDSHNEPALVSCLVDNLHYVSADRLGPQSLYDISQSAVDKNEVGIRGEYAVHYLQSNGVRHRVDPRLKHKKVDDLSLKNQVDGWLSEISPGVRVNIDEVMGTDKMVVNYDFELGIGRTARFRPGNVGYGISFSLAVILLLLTANEKSIIVIENPEAHIHPKGQAILGRLMALCASSGAQVFVETHSDHIINGVRVAVREKLLDKDQASVCWFTKTTTDSEQYTELTQINIDERGELSEYPEDFLDEWNNQLLRLV